MAITPVAPEKNQLMLSEGVTTMTTMTTDVLLNRRRRYLEALEHLPPSGGGGCHAALLGVANLGILASVTTEEIRQDIRTHIRGTRPVSDREIEEAVAKAARERGQTPSVARNVTRLSFNPDKALQGLIESGSGTTVDRLRALSPIPVPTCPTDMALAALSRLFEPQELVFMGERQDAGELRKTIRPRAAWEDAIREGRPLAPFFIPNPLSGEQTQNKSGNLSYRCDAAVTRRRHLVVEFDGIPIEQQLCFWAAVRLPIVGLVFSGSRSIHAWIAVDAESPSGWDTLVRAQLYPRYLEPLGVDSSCKNESRLTRTPGHTRSENGQVQELLWLSEKPRSVLA